MEAAKMPKSQKQSLESKGAVYGNPNTASFQEDASAEGRQILSQLLNNQKSLKKDIMTERGRFYANGFFFDVKPIYLGEEDDYIYSLNSTPFPSPKYDEKGDVIPPTDKDLSAFLIYFFSIKAAELDGKKFKLFLPTSKRPLTARMVKIIKRFKRNYLYYCDNPNTMILAMWIERKVSINGKPVRFYDLERKYHLNKAEIESLISYMHELSGF